MDIVSLGNRVMEGIPVTKKEAIWLYTQPLEVLCSQADRIRRVLCLDTFEFCTTICDRHRSGRPQNIPNQRKLLERAMISYAQELMQCSIGTGREGSKAETFEQICQRVCEIQQAVPVDVCVHAGFLDGAQYMRLKEAEGRQVYYDLDCLWQGGMPAKTTSYDKWIKAARNAGKEGISLCMGVSIGLGEGWKDRIKMAFLLRELKIKDVVFHTMNRDAEDSSIPVDELRRMVAIYRFILPKAVIRLGNGRGFLQDKGYSCFCAGANGAVTGDMLNTAGITVEMDQEQIEKLGYKIKDRKSARTRKDLSF